MESDHNENTEEYGLADIIYFQLPQSAVQGAALESW
jgi:hypothetical protein